MFMGAVLWGICRATGLPVLAALFIWAPVVWGQCLCIWGRAGESPRLVGVSRVPQSAVAPNMV